MRPERLRPSAIGLQTLLFLALALPAAAQVPANPPTPFTEIRYLSPERVFASSQTVVRVTVSSVKTAVLNDTVYTDALCSVKGLWKGAADPVILVRQVGGETPTLVTTGGRLVDLKPGENWILCLTQPPHGWFTIYGMVQGGFLVVKDDAVRDYGLLVPSDQPGTIRGGREAIPLAQLRKRWKLPEETGFAPPSAPEDAPQSPPISAPASSAPGKPAAPEKKTFTSDTPAVAGAAAIFIVLFLAAWLLLRRRRARGRLVGLLLVGGITLAAEMQAPAYVRIAGIPRGNPGASWDFDLLSPEQFFLDGKLEYRLVVAGVFEIPAGAYRQAVVHGAATWVDCAPCTLDMVRGPDITASPWDTDFSIAFSDASENTQKGGSVAGYAGLAYVTASGPKIYGADVCFNRTVTWNTDGTPNDLEGVALHEIGHAIGLHHPPHIGSNMSYTRPIDYDANTPFSHRRLCRDDRIAITDAYPPANWSTTTGVADGTISLGATPVHKAVISVFDGSGELVATILSKDGNYEVRGLPAGNYTLRPYAGWPHGSGYGLWQPPETMYWTSTQPTQFGATSANDVNVTVAAGSTTTTAISVAAGANSMEAIRSIRSLNGGFTWSLYRCTTQIQRGDTVRLGISGYNLPTSAGGIASVSIPGDGTSIIGGPYFDGGAGGPPADYAGMDHIAYDVQIDAGATPGDRALIFQNSSGERLIVSSFIEVMDVGSASAGAGASNPPAGTIVASQIDKEMLQATVTAGPYEPVRVRRWTISNGGNGADSEVAAVRVYRDANGDGNVDPTDPLLGSGTYSGGTAEVLCTLTVPAGGSADFLVTYDFTASVANNKTYSADVDALLLSGVDSGAILTLGGLPIAGNNQTVNLTGNAVPLAPDLLLCEGAASPVAGVSDPTPEFRARFNDNSDNSSQYQIEVADVSATGGDGSFTTPYWVGPVSDYPGSVTVSDGAQCPDIPYAGTAPAWEDTYYWHIRMKDSAGQWSPWSATAEFTMAAAPAPPPAPDNLLCQESSSPVANVTDPTPEFSARFNQTGASSNQYKLEVSLYSFTNPSDGAFVLPYWSPPVSSYPGSVTVADGNQCPNLIYAGTTLNWSTTYYWHIRMRNEAGEWSQWSSVASFSMKAAAQTASANGNGSPTGVSWRMVCVPIQVGATISASELYDDVGSLYRWDEPTRQWVSVGSGETLTGGVGYYTQSAPTTTLDISTGQVTEGTQTINLSYTTLGAATGAEITDGQGANAYRGNNLVANPFNTTISWDDPPGGNVTKNNVSSIYYKWDGSQYVVYNSATSLGAAGPAIGPFQAFGVIATAPGASLEISAPAGFGSLILDPPPGPDVNNWHLEISAESGTAIDSENIAGMNGLADDLRDPKDSEEPGAGAATYVLLYFDHPDWPEQPGRYTHDFRSPVLNAGEQVVWDVTVEANTAQPVTLTWPNVADIPDDWTLELHDPADGSTYDLRLVPSVVLPALNGKHKLVLRVTRVEHFVGSLLTAAAPTKPVGDVVAPGTEGVPMVGIHLCSQLESVVLTRLEVRDHGDGNLGGVSAWLHRNGIPVAGPATFVYGRTGWSNLSISVPLGEPQLLEVVYDFGPNSSGTYQASIIADVDLGGVGMVSGRAIVPGANLVEGLEKSAPAAEADPAPAPSDDGSGRCGSVGLDLTLPLLLLAFWKRRRRRR